MKQLWLEITIFSRKHTFANNAEIIEVWSNELIFIMTLIMTLITQLSGGPLLWTLASNHPSVLAPGGADQSHGNLQQVQLHDNRNSDEPQQIRLGLG